MDAFHNAISTHLDALSLSDPMFAAVYKTNGKDIPDCCNFIIEEVRKTGRIGFSDEEIYGIAKHYFEEADIKPFKGSAPGVKVVTNQSSQETFADRVKQADVKTQQNPEKAKVKATAPKEKEVKLGEQLSLFW